MSLGLKYEVDHGFLESKADLSNNNNNNNNNNNMQ